MTPIDSANMALLTEQASQALARQAVRVDEHRARAATLFSAAAVAGAFLGAEAFKDPKGPGLFAWIGAALLAASGAFLAYVAWPRSWVFVFDIPKMMARIRSEALSADQAKEALLIGLWNNYEENEPKLVETSMALGAMAVLVVGEIVALFLNLAVR